MMGRLPQPSSSFRIAGLLLPPLSASTPPLSSRRLWDREVDSVRCSGCHYPVRHGRKKEKFQPCQISAIGCELHCGGATENLPSVDCAALILVRDAQNSHPANQVEIFVARGEELRIDELGHGG